MFVNSNAFFLFGFLFFLNACYSPHSQSLEIKNDSDLMPQTDEFKDDRPGVTGIGGIFFYSENPEETKSWYATHLGLKTNPWGSTFEFRNANAPDKVNYLQWSPFEKGSPYFAPSSNEFMINYRVRHLDALLARLREDGVEILDDVETYEYGRFVHILDPEGRKIELWEPIDSVLTAMGGETTR